MKKLFTIVFLMALSTSIFAQYQFFDFSAVCPSGDTLYYSFIDDTTVAVSPPHTNWSGYTQPTGNLIIPEVVEYEGNAYTVVSIDQHAFYQCHALTSVEFPNTIVSIQEDAFSYSGLTTVEIPNSVTTVHAWAFAHCTDLLSLTIGSSVATIETGAFRYCTNLQSIYCNTPALPKYSHAYNLYFYDDEIFENVPTDIPVYVSCLAFDQFATNEQWDQFTNLQGVFVGVPQLEVVCNSPDLGTTEVVSIPENCEDNTAFVRATPNPGHVFSYWKKGIEMVCFSPEYTFTLDQNTTLVACFDSSPIVYDSIAFPDHISGQKLNIWGEVTYEYPSEFIYNQDGILMNYTFTGCVSTNYSFEHFPSRPSTIHSTYAGHPYLTEDCVFNYNTFDQIIYYSQTWNQVYDGGYAEYFYDDNHRLYQKMTTRDDGYILNYQYEYEDGNRTQIESLSVGSENNLRLYSITTNHYNTRHQVIDSQTDIYNNSGVVALRTLQTFSYTAHHKTDSIVTQQFTDGNWTNSAVAHYVYDEKDRVVEYQTGAWSADNSIWNITKKTIYHFDDDAQILTISFLKKNADEWAWDVFSDQTLFFDPNLDVWQRACNNYSNNNVNQFTINLHYVTIEKTIPRLSEWYYEIQWDDGITTFQHLEYTTDTVMQGKRPKVIVRSNTHYDRDEPTIVTHEYIYEEGNIVYWWNKDLEEFTTLYDYNAEAGDEWEIKVGTESITVHVDDVDVFEYDGETHKRLYISDAGEVFNGEIVVGFGHMTSFFPEKLMNQGRGFRVDGLRCYWVEDALLYHNGDEDCDAIHSVLQDIDEQPDNAVFAVYPNPTNGVLYVETVCTPSLPDPTYRITNLMGQTLLQGTLQNETQQIDISTLPAGMYYISVSGQTMKFVVK